MARSGSAAIRKRDPMSANSGSPGSSCPVTARSKSFRCAMSQSLDIEVTRNRFVGAKDNYLRCSGDRQVPTGMNLHENTIILAAGTKIAYGDENPETIEQSSEWQTRTGQERGSIFATPDSASAEPAPAPAPATTEPTDTTTTAPTIGQCQ